MSTTCIQCRGRKVRCGGPGAQDGKCSNCIRLKFDCSFATGPDASVIPTPSDTYTQGGTRRQRGRRACEACKSQKQRCSGTSPKCLRCIERDLECMYRPSRRGRKEREFRGEITTDLSPDTTTTPTSIRASLPEEDRGRPAGPPQDHTNNVLSAGVELFHRDQSQLLLGLDKEDLKKHIDAFFKYVHPVPFYSFLHRALILQDISKGTCSLSLIRIICAAASVFLAKTQEERVRALEWAEAAEYEIFKSLGRPALCKIQTIMLIVYLRSVFHQANKVLLWLSLASRMAYISRLNYECDSESFLFQESRRRLMWSVYVLDTIYSASTPEFTVCPRSNMHISLPCDERNFELDIRTQTRGLTPDPFRDDSNLGISAYIIRILDIRDRILRYTKDVVARNCRPEDSAEKLAQFDMELQNFRKSLSLEYQFSTKSLQLRVFSNTCTSFIMLHAHWHQCYCDLYRFTMPHFRESFSTIALRAAPVEFVSSCRQKCVDAAIAMSEFFRNILQIETEDEFLTTDSAISIFAYQCARILMKAPDINPDLAIYNSDLVINALHTCIEIVTPLTRVHSSARRIKADINAMIDLLRSGQGQTRSSGLASPIGSEHEQGRLPKPSYILSKYGTVNSAQEREDDETLPPMIAPNEQENSTHLDHTLGSVVMDASPFTQRTTISDPFDPSFYNSNPSYDLQWAEYPILSFDEAQYQIMADPFMRIHEEWPSSEAL